MKQVIIFPRGQLSDDDRVALLNAGIVAVQADDPDKVITVVPAASIVSADDLFISALAGLNCDPLKNKREVFVSELFQRLTAKESHESEQS